MHDFEEQEYVVTNRGFFRMLLVAMPISLLGWYGIFHVVHLVARAVTK